MARARKRHIQESFIYGDKNGQRRGVDKHYRPGRPKPKGQRPSERHKVRPHLLGREPIHVTVRVTKAVGKLRKRHIYLAIRRAMVTTFHRTSFRIVHASIQNSHLHLLVEADDRMALARGMQGFLISAAKHINAALGKESGEKRRGCVFADRYHATAIASRRGVWNRLVYVMNNWRHHREDRFDNTRGFAADPFSTGPSFTGWNRQIDDDWPATYEPLPVWEPKTWLLREGWRMYGLIDPDAVPGKGLD
jgi:REP element-mobilizing transposase RayT